MKKQTIFLVTLCLAVLLALSTINTQAQSTLKLEKPSPGSSDVLLNNVNGNNTIFKIQGSEKMRLTSLGRLGIGTTNPLTRFHVNLNNNRFISLTSAQLNTLADGRENFRIFPYYIDNSDNASKYNNGHPLTIFEAPIKSGVRNDILFTWCDLSPAIDVGIMIKGSGNVGIGTYVPGAKLHVDGDAIKTDGETWTVASDRVLKKEIQDFADGLQTVLSIQPKTFRYNGKAGFSDNGKKHVGIIAQEIQTIAPYMVSEFYRKLEKTDATDTRLLKYNSSALPYILVNAIKELNTKVEANKTLNGANATLKSDLEALKKENTDLKTKLADLESRLKSIEESLKNKE
ncbi:MAG TPA: hypothetical protein DCS93_05090 [Microscillaceae bacterium]|nr:hypothetical protein [Microscillaceae bacterium]